MDNEVNLFRGPGDQTTEVTPERRREIQANMFAAALLMPEDAVRQTWPRVKTIEGMARRFNLSEAAMGIRITQLGLA